MVFQKLVYLLAVIGLVTCRPTRVIVRDSPSHTEYVYYDSPIIREITYDGQDVIVVQRPVTEVIYEDYEPTFLDRLSNTWDALTS